jgi:hypothetical protein
VTPSLLSLQGLRVSYDTRTGPLHAGRGVDLDVASGEIVALVGETGSGRSTTAHAVTGLLSRGGRMDSGRDLAVCDEPVSALDAGRPGPGERPGRRAVPGPVPSLHTRAAGRGAGPDTGPVMRSDSSLRPSTLQTGAQRPASPTPLWAIVGEDVLSL